MAHPTLATQTAPPAALLAAVAFHGVRSPSGPILAEPLSDVAWAALLVEVERRRLPGFLVAAIADGALAATSSQLESAQRAHAAALRRCMLLEHCLLRVDDLLSEARIQHQVLKGPALAHLVYRPPSIRTFLDIDLLVPPAQFEAALDLLVTGGYRRASPELRPGFDRAFSKAVTLVGAGDTQVDLHRTLAFGRFGLNIDAGQLFEQPAALEVAGRSLLALGPEPRFLHACYHATLSHDAGRLLPLRDVAEILVATDLDLSRVHQLATAWRGEPVVASALALLRERAGIAAPPGLGWALRHPTRPAERRALRATGTGGEAVGALAAIHGPAHKLRFLWALAVPDRAFLRHRGHRGYLSWWGQGAWSAVAGLRFTGR